MKKALNSKMSTRQLRSLLFVALLSAVVRGAVSASARTAGRAGWLAPAAGFIALCVALLPYLPLLRARGDDEGLMDVYSRAAGRVTAKALACVYILWTLAQASVSMRAYAERFADATLRDAPLWLLALIMAAFLTLILWNNISYLARSAQVFIGVQLALLLVVILFSLKNISPDRLFPLRGGDVLPVCEAGLGFFDRCAAAFAAAFLAGYVKKESKSAGMLLRGTALLCLLSAALIFVTIGSFSAELTEHMRRPTWLLSKNINMVRTFSRIDSLMVALWVFNEISYLGVTCFAAAELLRFLTGAKSTRPFAIPVAVLVGGAALAVPDTFWLDSLTSDPSPLFSIVLCFGLPAILYIVGKLRRKI